MCAALLSEKAAYNRMFTQNIESNQTKRPNTDINVCAHRISVANMWKVTLISIWIYITCTYKCTGFISFSLLFFPTLRETITNVHPAKPYQPFLMRPPICHRYPFRTQSVLIQNPMKIHLFLYEWLNIVSILCV